MLLQASMNTFKKRKEMVRCGC